MATEERTSAASRREMKERTHPSEDADRGVDPPDVVPDNKEDEDDEDEGLPSIEMLEELPFLLPFPLADRGRETLPPLDVWSETFPDDSLESAAPTRSERYERRSGVSIEINASMMEELRLRV